jgi:GDPmannose 4,6-dehydratase
MNEARHACVLGVNGQDGSYLAEHLLAEGWRVTGIGRQPSSRFVRAQTGFAYRQLDLGQDQPALLVALRDARPARIFHFAAVHGPSGFFYEPAWQEALAVNTGSVHTCLEYIRNEDREARLFYASSSKAFGEPLPERINESTPLVSSCLYSITKNAAVSLIREYRARHGIRATVAFFFNHDSPRRPNEYFLPRVVEQLARAVTNKEPAPALSTLDFAFDGGSSAEYARFAHRLLELDANDDYIVATGRTFTGREFVESLFGRAGLDWRNHVPLQSPPGSRPIAVHRAEVARLSAAVGSAPAMTALDVAPWILGERYGLTLSGDTGGSDR